MLQCVTTHMEPHVLDYDIAKKCVGHRLLLKPEHPIDPMLEVRIIEVAPHSESFKVARLAGDNVVYHSWYQGHYHMDYYVIDILED